MGNVMFFSVNISLRILSAPILLIAMLVMVVKMMVTVKVVVATMLRARTTLFVRDELLLVLRSVTEVVVEAVHAQRRS